MSLFIADLLNTIVFNFIEEGRSKKEEGRRKKERESQRFSSYDDWRIL
ncbi:MAG: hypothetical protein F6K18_19875 [Okeania sp. SIO2C2]|nr:hypothetical protein [Okeania sp. SIO2C2]NEP88911.1 hypothetical protein [Okeania sp. SIO2C2]